MSLIRDNLMTRPGYSPYCGNHVSCAYGMPRTHYKRHQFECMCGWRSGFDAEFIARFEAKWATPQPPAPPPKSKQDVANG